MKIGIFGGTFDPVHIGHMNVAQHAIKQFRLDKLIFMPCNIPPHKTRKDIVPSQDRLEMIRLAIEEKAEYGISEYEVARRGTTHSIDMLADLKKEHPDDELYFIIGSDSYEELTTWKGHDRIPGLARLLVAPRSGHADTRLAKGILEVEMRPVNVSSSQIRSILREGGSIKGLVTDRVEDYIKQKRLYKGPKA